MDLEKTLTILGKETDTNIEWNTHAGLGDAYFLFLVKTRALNHNCYVNNLDININNSGLDEYNLNSILDEIGSCIKSGVNTIIIPMKPISSHSNLLIYRHDKHVLEHYEPHGSSYRGPYLENFQEKLNAKIGIFRDNLFYYITDLKQQPQPQIQIIESNVVCPISIYYGFQAFVQFRGTLTAKEKEKGYCTAWTLFMAYFVLRYPEFSTAELFNKIIRFMFKINNNDEQKIGAYMTNILRRFISKLNNALFKYLNILYDEQMTFEKINNRINNIVYDIFYVVEAEKFLINNNLDKNSTNILYEYEQYANRNSQFILSQDDIMSQHEKIKIRNIKNMLILLNSKGLLNRETGLSPIIGEEESLDDKELNKIDNLIRQKINEEELIIAKSKLKHVSSSERGTRKSLSKSKSSSKSSKSSKNSKNSKSSKSSKSKSRSKSR